MRTVALLAELDMAPFLAAVELVCEAVLPELEPVMLAPLDLDALAELLPEVVLAPPAAEEPVEEAAAVELEPPLVEPLTMEKGTSFLVVLL